MKIDFLNPAINDSDIKRMVKSIKSGWLVHGEYTKQFETKVNSYLGLDENVGNSCFMTASCTASLHMSLILAGVNEGDEVITTPITWVATSNVILYQRATPVFVDVDPLTGLLDIDKIEEKITSKTKAIIVVHLYGQMADMVKLRSIGDKYGIKIIEDAAHSLEAMRDGYRPGQLGFTACLSFHAAKNLTCGQGGAIITSDKDMCKLLVRDGVTNINGKRVMLDFGYKYDLTDFQAALLVGQIQRVEKSHAKRLKVFERYREDLKNLVSFPSCNSVHACHMFVIWVDPNERDTIREKLSIKGVDTSIHYTPVHLEPYYQKLGYKKGSLPVAERLGEATITLPTYALTSAEQDYVIKCLKEVL